MQGSYVQQYESLEKYHWWWLARRKMVSATLTSLAQGKGKQRVLDAGCGAGLQLAALRDEFHVYGLEPDRNLAEIARINSGVQIFERTLPLSDGSLPQVDYLLLLDVLEHLDDDIACLRSLTTVIAKGGHVMINVPAHSWLWSVHDEVNQHKRRYSRKMLMNLLAECGLQPVVIQFWGSALVPFAYLRKFIRSSSQEYRVHVSRGVLVPFMTTLIRLESYVARQLRLPFGLSLFAVARKA